MHSSAAHPRLWDYCTTLVSELRCRTSLGLYDLKSRTPIESVTGTTPDISEYVAFRFFQTVWHLNPHDFPAPQRTIGRWLGVAHNVRQALCYWLITNTGHVLARSTVQAMSADELTNPIYKSQFAQFDTEMNAKLDRGQPHNTFIADVPSTRLFNDHKEDYEPIEIDGLKPEIESFDADAYDRL